MKKLLKFVPLLLIAVVGVMMSSCSDDDKDAPSNVNLPATAQAFINQYFPQNHIKLVKEDNNEYEVTLSSGIEIEFTKAGEWSKVEAPDGQNIPKKFYPLSIDEYIGLHIDGAIINEVSRTTSGYTIGLVGGQEVYFDSEGQYLNTLTD